MFEIGSVWESLSYEILFMVYMVVICVLFKV